LHVFTVVCIQALVVWVVNTRRHNPDHQYLKITYRYEIYVLEQAKLY